ncbi:nitroreductase [Ammonicoccus fulvus]|uniref:Nitroreductase n=1 Tax=Ammonicoccus fulvus TaxID=3138240 RepID=A0ABZ3FUJ7_9ACTN
MEVRDAVHARRSIRAFTDREIEPELLTRLLTDAAYAPSGGNLQPWHVTVVRGAAMADLKARMMARLTDPTAPEPTPEFPLYPSPLKSPYRERRFRNGEMLYELLGIPRTDKPARLRQFARNYLFFDAPVGLFVYVDRQMNAPQWADLGMFLQTLMLLLTEAGVDSCPQLAWSTYHDTVAEVTRPSEELVLFSGLAIGYADPSAPENNLRTERAPLDEWCTVLE